MLHNPGRLALVAEDRATARARLREALAIHRDTRGWVGVMHALAAQARLVAAEGRSARALRLGTRSQRSSRR